MDVYGKEKDSGKKIVEEKNNLVFYGINSGIKIIFSGEKNKILVPGRENTGKIGSLVKIPAGIDNNI